MWFFCGFEYIAKITTGYISWQWVEFVFGVREMAGKSQGIFFCQPCGNPEISLKIAYLQCSSNLTGANELKVSLKENASSY